MIIVGYAYTIHAWQMPAAARSPKAQRRESAAEFVTTYRIRRHPNALKSISQVSYHILKILSDTAETYMMHANNADVLSNFDFRSL